MKEDLRKENSRLLSSLYLVETKLSMQSWIQLKHDILYSIIAFLLAWIIRGWF
jgi:hypothetical protein